MRRLHPDHAEAVELAAAYAYPDGPHPWLRANMVAGADGAATIGGTSRGLSSPADRRLLQLLRGLADVIVVGASTVRRERYGAVPAREDWQPQRRAAGQAPAPAIAVVSQSLDLDPDSALFTAAHADARTTVLTAGSAPADRLRALGKVADVIVAGERDVALDHAVDELVRRGHTRLLSEGGPNLLAEITAAGRLDELCLTLSPLLSAGSAQRILTGDAFPQPARMELAHVLEEDGHLFLRYILGTATSADASRNGPPT